MNDDDILLEIEKKLGYGFRDRARLVCALTHSSYAHEEFQAATGNNPAANRLEHYERLEFLGDAVLGLVISDLILHRFPEAPEGELSRVRAGLVNSERLALMAGELGVGSGLRLGRGEESTGGKAKPSILAAALEAVLAAIYLEGGFEEAKRVIARLFQPLLDSLPPLDLLGDFKTPLQEKVQARFKTMPAYRVLREDGPDHMKTFEVEVLVNGEVLAQGEGRSKKEAEQDAARGALHSLKLKD